MILFYCPQLDPSSKEGVLPESDSQHAVRVLRMKEGMPLQAIDGKGNMYFCTLTEANVKHAAFLVERCEPQSKSWSVNISLGIAPTKNMDRIEWLVEKLIEIGIDRITPLECARSERRTVKSERLEKIAVAAVKQSLKATMPEIDEMTKFQRFVDSFKDSTAQKFIAYCDKYTPRVLLARAYQPGRDAVVLIGPEGDFAPEEVKAAFDAGFIPVTLGNTRLRTETAGLVAVDTFHILNQRLL